MDGLTFFLVASSLVMLSILIFKINSKKSDKDSGKSKGTPVNNTGEKFPQTTGKPKL